MERIMDQLNSLVSGFAPSFLGAVLLLIVGGLVAWSLANLLGVALRRTKMDIRLAKWIMGDPGRDRDVEKWSRRGMFWLLMIFVIMGILQVLGLTLAVGPLEGMLNTVFEFLPRIAAGAILLVAAWVVATVLKLLLSKALAATGIDRKVSEKAELGDENGLPLTRTISEAVYWLVFLLFLPAVLETLSLEGLLKPIQSLLDKVLTFLPNIATAALILVVGWFLARIVQRVVKNLLAALGADRFAEKIGIADALGSQGLSGAMGLVVYILILIPVLIASLNALALHAITVPASNMLDTILSAIPPLFGAALLMGIAYAVAHVISKLIGNMLAGVGFDSLMERLGFGGRGEAQWGPSEVVARLILVAVLLFAGIEALRMIHFETLANLVNEFLVFAGHVILGLAIFGVGLYLANLAKKAIETSNSPQAALLATAARVSIVVLAGAVGLREMGVGKDIILLAFGLVVGAIAVASAIAFGIGGRDIARRKLEVWTKKTQESGASFDKHDTEDQQQP
ncbi:MAG: mechanosensitive ion channel [Deltaproteobacteria bacterium]|nr:mechanosensitive ion channel [Deltaproteobacteria bacterium]